MNANAIFRALAAANVRHCLWRGSPRLARASAGLSDFDVLVDGTQAGLLTEVLARHGLRRARAPASRSVPGLEDWLGLAGPHGPLLHYHVHYRLVAGPGTSNQFRLPWQQQVLESRVRATGAEIDVAHPVVESGLLLVRCALQLRLRDRVPGAPARSALVAKVNADLAQLLTAERIPELDALLRQWLGSVPVTLHIDDQPAVTIATLWRLRQVIVGNIGHLAAVPGGRAALRSWRHEFRSVLRRVAQRCRLPVLPNRVGLAGGLLVLLQGREQDETGAPAAALANSLRQVFGSKFDVFLALGGDRQLRRAQQARARGMLAIGAIRAPDLGAGHSPDLVLALGAPASAAPAPGSAAPHSVPLLTVTGDHESALATAVQAIWNRL